MADVYARNDPHNYCDDPEICWAWGCIARATVAVAISFDGEDWMRHTMCRPHAEAYASGAPYADMRLRNLRLGVN